MFQLKNVIGLIFLALNIGNLLAQNERMAASSFGQAGVTVSRQAWDSVLVEGSTTNVLTYKIPIEKTFYITDNKGNIQTEETFDALGKPIAHFVPRTKKLNTYNENGQIETTETMQWDSVSGFYLEDLQSVFSYQSDNVVIEKKYRWKNEYWQLYDSVKIVTTYNLNFDPEEQIYYTHKNITWSDSAKTVYTYDSQNRLTEVLNLDLKDVVTQNSGRTTIVYDEDGKTAEITQERWNGSAWERPVFKKNNYELVYTGRASYSMIARLIHHFSGEQQKKDDVQPYPNPADDGFYVNAGNEVAAVAIYSLRGSLLHSEEVSGTSYVNVGKLGSGTFLVKITLKGQTITKRLQIK